MTIIENDTAEVVSGSEVQLKPKVGRIPVTLRLLNEEEQENDGIVWASTARKSETQFMFFLVTLFVVVNITLVFLLSYKGKSTPVVSATVATPTTQTPPTAPTPAVSAKPEVGTNVPTATKENLPPPPPPAALLSSPTPPVPSASVAAPVSAKESYVTPVSPETSKATAAPFHPVTVSDHHELQISNPPSSVAPELKVIQSHNIAPTSTKTPSSLVELAPAAATPVQTTPPPIPAVVTVPTVENPTQDLLSVITKD